MKKNKRTLKGMTLIEVLVSLAVFAMLSGILLGYGASVDKTSKATRIMKNKVVEEAHYASAQQKQYSVDEDGDGHKETFYDLDSVATQITVTMDGLSGTFTPFIDNDPTKGYDNEHPVSYSDPSTVFETEVFSTVKAYEAYLRSQGYTDAEIAAARDQANGEIDINFVENVGESNIISRSH